MYDNASDDDITTAGGYLDEQNGDWSKNIWCSQIPPKEFQYKVNKRGLGDYFNLTMHRINQEHQNEESGLDQEIDKYVNELTMIANGIEWPTNHSDSKDQYQLGSAKRDTRVVSIVYLQEPPSSEENLISEYLL